MMETSEEEAREKATSKGKKRSRENTVEEKRRTRKNRKKRKRFAIKISPNLYPKIGSGPEAAIARRLSK
jgi:hypothetical protein